MPRNGIATWDEAARQARSWSGEVLACRTRGHSWEQDTSHPENGSREGRNYIVHFYCTRGCEVHKVQRWDQRGAVLRTSTSYPKDAAGHQTYLSGLGRLDAEAKGALRIATLDSAPARRRRKLRAV